VPVARREISDPVGIELDRARSKWAQGEVIDELLPYWCRRSCTLAPDDYPPYRCRMPTVTLQAHYDGRQIILDGPYNLPANAKLRVTILPSVSDPDAEEVWLRAASASAAFAFLADPAEDIYTVANGDPFRDAL